MRSQALLDSAQQQVFGTQSDDTQHGWRQPMALGQNFGDDLLLRAFISRQSIGALETLEAAYPRCDTDADGLPLSGEHVYAIRFGPDQLPRWTRSGPSRFTHRATASWYPMPSNDTPLATAHPHWRVIRTVA